MQQVGIFMTDPTGIN